MNQTQDFILAMSQNEAATFKNLHAAAHDMESLTLKTMTLGIVVTLIIGLIIHWKLRQDLLDRQHLQQRVLEEATLAEVSRLTGDMSCDIKNMLPCGTRIPNLAIPVAFSHLARYCSPSLHSVARKLFFAIWPHKIVPGFNV